MAFILLAPMAASAQGEGADTAAVEYDRFTRTTTTTMEFGSVGNGLKLTVFSSEPGETMPTRLRVVSMIFRSSSASWFYLPYRGVPVKVLADNVPVQGVRSTIEGSAFSGGVSETIALTLTPAQFTKIAKAGVAEFSIGPGEIALGQTGMAKMRGLFALLSGKDPEQNAIKKAIADRRAAMLPSPQKP